LDVLSELVAVGDPATAGTKDVLRRSADLKVIPLSGHGREIGAIRLLRDEGQLYGDESASFLSGIGAQVAMAVMAGALYEDVVRRQRTAQALYAIAVEITSLENAQEVLWPIAERAREMLRADAVAISLLDQAGEGFTLAAHSGRPQAFRSPHTAGSWFPLGAVESQAVLPDRGGSGCPIADPSFSRYAAPLHAGSERIGELSVAVAGSRRFNEEEQHLLGGMADLAAIAVQKSRLLERERQVAVLEERERLAREMHDSLAQVLGYLHLKSETALRKLRADDIPKTETELQEMATLAKEAYADVREAILGLRESVSSSRGFVDALREYLQKFSRQAGVAVQLDVEGDDNVGLGPEAEVQLMRVIQEALTNVRKHANANRARVSINRHGGEAAIVVEDNGQGFDANLLRQPDVITFGLRTMKERVERVGGRFTVDSVPSEGTKVQIFVPVNGGHNHE
jgi:signal transduction histidine kinase